MSMQDVFNDMERIQSYILYRSKLEVERIVREELKRAGYVATKDLKINVTIDGFSIAPAPTLMKLTVQ